MGRINYIKAKRYSILLIILCFNFFIYGCKTTRHVAYFRDIPDSLSAPMVLQHTKFDEPKINSGDVLNISIQTIDPRAVEMISGSNASNGLVTSSTQSVGVNNTYLVDQNGYIELAIVGRVKVAGLTITETKDVLHEKAKQYYTNPIVNVRNNFVISVFGDVLRPGTFTIPNDKVSVLDAISLAGDLNISGKRQNVLLLHEEGNEVIASRLDLTSTALFNNPNYYLKSGDKIYIEPNRAKKRSATVDLTQDRYITYAVSIITILLAISSRL